MNLESIALLNQKCESICANQFVRIKYGGAAEKLQEAGSHVWHYVKVYYNVLEGGAHCAMRFILRCGCCARYLQGVM